MNKDRGKVGLRSKEAGSQQPLPKEMAGEGIITELQLRLANQKTFFSCILDLGRMVERTFMFLRWLFLGYRHHLCHSTLFTKWDSHFVPRTKDTLLIVVWEGLITWEV